MEKQLDEESPTHRSSFYNQVTQAKHDMKALLESEEHKETVRKSVLGFSAAP